MRVLITPLFLFQVPMTLQELQSILYELDLAKIPIETSVKQLERINNISIAKQLIPQQV